MTYRKLPPLNAVRAFEAAARHLSVTRAAAELSVTPGAVSRQIRDLEQRLRTDLFIRSANGLALTPGGEIFFAAARDALDGIAAGALRTERIAASGRRRLSVGAYSHFASRWLIPRWPRFYERYTDVDIDLTTTSDPLELAPHRFDAVIAVSHGGPVPGFEVMPIVPIEMAPVCSPGLIGDGPFDLHGRRLLHSRQRPQDWRRWLAMAGMTDIDPDAGLVFESISLAIDAAAEGLGVALAIHALIDHDLALGRVMIPIPRCRTTSRSFVLIHEAARTRDPALSAFREWLAEEARAYSFPRGTFSSAPHRQGAATST
jgi:LysR family transcriptional regulator, glycine cleavage system transcriptional activator